MCGIMAVVGGPKNILINDALRALSKRGPDDKGLMAFEKCTLAQTRLSIIDITGGHQPMKDNERNQAVVFNGEIYNYKELRKKLEEKGHRFITNSDTEVILKAYSEYGLDCPKYLDGMFMFALWDEEKQELFFARDRFGKKPFYYTHVDGAFMGASEIKALFATDLVKGKVSPEVLDDYLRLMYVPPDKTIYSNIKTVLPAHAGIVKNGDVKTWRYWKLEKNPSRISYKDAKQEVKHLFDEAVKKRMVADVEIGSLLSGGVDSTLVTAYAQKYSKTPLKTFCIGYGEYINELPFAKQASEKIGTDHYTKDIPATDLNELKKVVEYFDEPHGDSSNFPQHVISGLASSKVKVALSGDGADELCMGYGWYQKYWHTPIYKRVFTSPFGAYKKMTEVFSSGERNSLLAHSAHPNISFEKEIIHAYRSGFDKINAYDLEVYLPGQLLTKVDRTSMMHSLEIRSPFLDTSLAEFIFNLPREYKISKTDNKLILKDLLEEIMPKDFVRRRKQGFGAPIEKWLEEDVIKNELDRIVKNSNHPMYAYVNKQAVMDVFKNQKGRKVWSLLCLALWFEAHKHHHA